MDNFIITISRECGSGGKLIGQKLAEKLGIPCYDKSVVQLSSIQSGLAQEVIESAENNASNSFLYNLYISTQYTPIQNQIFFAQSKVIEELAQKGSCVFIGRCADYILRDYKNCFNVFIHASLPERIKHATEDKGFASKNIKSELIKNDKARANYYNHFTDRAWGEACNYHMCIDSDIGVDKCVDLLTQLVK